MSLPEGFEEHIQSLADNQIKERIANLTMAILEHKHLMDSNEELNKAKEQVKTLKEPFTAPMKECKEQIAYCKAVLDDRGKGVELPEQ